jgi:predicted negative regulator of RcsB-dependent stress response
MKNLVMRAVGLVVVAGVAFGWSTSQVEARPNYAKEFKDAYPSVKEKAEEAKCGVCHYGDKKTNRNDYGQALTEALGAKNVKDVDAIKAAIKKAAEGKSQSKGKTFGELIEAGELPGTNP